MGDERQKVPSPSLTLPHATVIGKSTPLHRENWVADPTVDTFWPS